MPNASSTTTRHRADHSSRPARSAGFSFSVYLLLALVTVVVALLCIGLGSVLVPPSEVAAAIGRAVSGAPTQGLADSIIIDIRLPRVINAGLVGAALALAGAAMQGLLKNPLADGSTLGVAAGASLGAVSVIVFGLTWPAWSIASPMIMACLGAFLSLMIILSLAQAIDGSLSTNTIILIGIIFSMFASSLLSLLIVFADDQLHNVIFWTMGSLAGTTYIDALVLAAVLIVAGGPVLSHWRELNAFAIGETNAHHIGVNVKHVRLVLLITVSALIGLSVAVAGSIAFVGLVVPHMARRLVGPHHRRLLPASLFGGAIFLMLCDLAARLLFSPQELPIGVITSLIGAIIFVHIVALTRRSAR
ncbi:MAG: iron ABC transporter permease [Propionibacteriaceae bacterium]|nr:iron ABC transporter permease [Propionibacteriaceae bacterium]